MKAEEERADAEAFNEEQRDVAAYTSAEVAQTRECACALERVVSGECQG